MATNFMPLPQLYRDEVIPALMKEFDYSSVCLLYTSRCV